MTKLADLRNSVNETARVARGNLWLLLAVGLYLLILLYGTDDMALLTGEDVAAPLMEVTVPVELMFGLGPVLFVLLHLNLLVRLDRLHHVSRLHRARLEAEEDPDERARQAVLLFPFDFLQLLFYGTGREPDARDRDPGAAAGVRPRPSGWRESLREWMRRQGEEGRHLFMVFLVLVPGFLIPLALLIAIQVRFVPYQSEGLTLFQQACVTADLVIQVAFAVRLGLVRRSVDMVLNGRRQQRVAYGIKFLIAFLSLVSCTVFVWTLAVVPGSRLEGYRPFPETMGLAWAVAFGDWWVGDGCSRTIHGWPSFMKRYLHVEDMTVAAGRPDGAIVAAYLERGEDPDLAWRFVDRLDLDGRSFRYARFDGSEFRRASFRGSDLRCARFAGSRLGGADLERAKAQDAEFRLADLTGARLEHGGFEGASFRRARLDGADAAHAAFAGADLREASLHGTGLSGATFRATDLRDAELHGADLADASILGSNANRAGFEDARLDGATVEATSFREARFHGTDMQGVKLELADLTGSTWERPQGRVRIRQEAGHARCVWTDGRGPFTGWSAPSRACREELERRRVKIACGNGRPGQAKGVERVLKPAEGWLDVGGILALLETGPEMCAAVDADIRRELCSELAYWFRTQSFGDAVEGGDFWREEYAGRAASWDEVEKSGVCGDP